MEWHGGNRKPKPELESAIRKRDIRCNVIGCTNIAVCVHHLDHDHQNDDPPNLGPSCQVHHLLEHGNSPQMIVLKLVVRELDQLQKVRIAMDNRVAAYERLSGLFDRECRQWITFSRDRTSELLRQEGGFDGVLKAILARYPIWEEWASQVEGVGPRLAARVMSEIGDIGRFATVSSLWPYAGEHVEPDGKAARKRKKNGSDEWSGAWNHRLKKASWMIGKSFVTKRGSFGRQLYDRYRAEYEARPDVAKRAHLLAMRRARKDFLRCLWAEWRRLEGLPLTDPQPGTWPMPEDWIDGRGEADGDLETVQMFAAAPVEEEAR